jgi:biotin transporter BioY
MVILLCGWAWLSQFMSASVAFHAGVTRFLIGDIIKIILAAAVLPAGWKLLNRKA